MKRSMVLNHIWRAYLSKTAFKKKRQRVMLLIILSILSLLLLILFNNDQIISTHSENNTPFKALSIDLTFGAKDLKVLQASELNNEAEKPIVYKNDWHIFVSSVHYVEDAEDEGFKNVVRLNILAENDLPNSVISCEVDGKLTYPNIRRFAGPTDLCKFGNYFLDCPADKRPESFALVGSNLFRHELKITETDKTPYTLVVCFSRIFFYENWMILLATLEMYKLYGADLMVVQLLSIISEIYTILKAYENMGKVRIKPASNLPKFPGLDYDPNAELEWSNIVSSYTGCLYDYRDSAQFILNVDVDDMVIPRHFGNLGHELISLSNQFPKASSFEFLWANTTTKLTRDPNTYEINEIIRNKYIHQWIDHGKSAIIPKRITVGRIHWPLEPDIRKGYSHVRLTHNDTETVHFRELIFDNSTVPEPNTYFTNNTQHFLLDLSLKYLLERNPSAKQAFFNLPTGPIYSKIIRDCHAEIFQQSHRGNLTSCPNVLVCNLEKTKIENLRPCTVLKNEYSFTKMSYNFVVSSVTETGFFPSENCLF